MSQQNVETVRRLYMAAARRDSKTVLALYHPEVEWDASRHPLGGLTGSAVYRGRDGLRNWFREWSGAWENFEDSYDELSDAGEQVISVGTVRAQGKSSRVDVALRLFAVWTIRDGKVVRVVWFETRAEAIKAAGLSD